MKMKRYIVMVLSLIVMLTAGCGGKQVVKPVDIPPSVGDKLIRSSEPEQPEWVRKTPPTVNGVLSFVGLSMKYAAEQQGRDDAEQHAIRQVAKHMGIVVKSSANKAKAELGLTSDIFDATIAEATSEKRLAVHMVQQVKTKMSYTEKWQTPTGSVYYRVYLWAEMPQAAIDVTLKLATRDMAKKAEQQVKEAGNEIAKKQAKDVVELFKYMQEQGQGVVE